MTFALVKNSIVVNIIEASSEFAAKLTEYDFVVDITALVNRPKIGWTYDGVNFIGNDTVPSPEEIAKEALRRQYIGELKTAKPLMTLQEASDAINKILVLLGVK